MLPEHWSNFCRKGNYGTRDQRASVKRCINETGHVRGYYSDILMDPTLPPTNALYPSHDHRSERNDDSDMVIDARVINDMKTILTEDEFWLIIEHLYAVGRQKGRIPDRVALRHDSWKPERNFA